MRNTVHGQVILNVSVNVNGDDYEGLLEANYNFNPERMVAYKLVAIDHHGNEHIYTVNEAIDVNLDTIIEQ